MTYYTTAELEIVTGCTSITKLKDAGLRPARPGRRGRSQTDLWTIPQVVGIAVWQVARGRGVEMSSAHDLARYLAGLPLREMQRHVADGRQYVMLVGTRAVAQMVTQPEIAAATRQAIDRLSDEDLGRAYHAGMMPVAVDIGLILRVVSEWTPTPPTSAEVTPCDQ